jgi:hypothetical protein
MAAPVVAILFAFLSGAALPVAALGSTSHALIAVDDRATAFYARLPASCAAVDPGLNRLPNAARSAGAKSRWRAIVAAAASRLARDADIACANANEPNTPAGRLKAAIDALSDLPKADRLAPPANPSH